MFDVAAGTFTLFGPRTFTRTTGAPQAERVTFAAPGAGGSVLHVESDGVASAIVTLNGATVLRPSDFKPSVRAFDKRLTLGEANLLTVELRSKPGSWLRLSIIRDDERPPTIRATAIPAADAAGWNNQDVTITFTCSDAESGVAVCPTPITVSAEGAGQVLSGEAVDGAGNRASVSATLNIDKTAPLVTLAASPNANANGWNNGDVTVSVSCAEPLSGVHACPGPQVVSREGASQVVMVQVSDIAGNTASASATVNIDRTAPHIVASLSAPANTTGWHNAPVSVTFTCEDDLAQIASCPAPVTVNGEGADQLITGIARDRADNSAAVAVRVSVDVTAPIVRAILSPVVENGWHNGEVTVSFVCEDGGSGVAECPTDRTVGSEGADQAVTVTVADRAGNVTTTTATVNIDRTAPTITTSVSGSPNAAGWHRSAVTVAFECADDRSGVTSCTEPVTVSTEGRSQIVTGVAFDAAGNRSVTTVALNIDTTPPVIQSALTPPGLWANISVQVGFQCTDQGSGIATCTPAQTVTTEGVSQRIEGRATDQAGNEAVATATVSIDRTPPVITPSVSPAANAQGWHRTNPTVSFACSDDASGVTDCSAPHVVTEEGRASIVVGSVRDVAGNTATASSTVNMDRTAPTVSVTSPAAGALVRTSPVVVTGSAADAVAGLAGIVCNGSPAGLTGALFSCEAGLLPGADDLTVTVTDAAGNIGTSVLAINFDPNDSPIAHPGGPYNAETATAVTYNGASSFDPDGGTLTFAWEFGDGGTATGPSPSHAYESAGTFIVRLTVRDPEGASHVATTTAVIVRANGNPVANAGGPYATDAGVPVNFDASASNDPDTDVLTYSWDFGDGGVGSGQRPRRTYVNPGVFTATLTVTDGRGGRHTAHTQVTIRTANQNPIAAAGGPYEGSATQAVTFSGAASHDPDNDPLTYAWSFGDGATASGQDASHRYEAAGHYNVSLTVTDGRGGSHSAGTQVTIATSNTAPIAHVGGPYSGRRGRAIAFSGSGSSDPDNDALTYAWSFGDGRGRTGANAEHAYDAPGTYTVTLTVDDGRGGTDATSTSVNIAETTTDDNRAPTAVAGGPYSGETGVPVIFSATASSDPDGDAVQFAWSFGDGTSASGPTPQHAYVQANAYTVTLTVTDAHGASQVATSSAIISAQADRTPPSVRVSGPFQVLPGTEVTISAFVDDIGTVTSVIFEVEGGQNTTLQTPPYQRRLLIPPVGSPGDTILVKAIATDGAGNIGTGSLLLTIASLPDSTAPVVRIVTPVETAAGAMLRVGATATDAAGVAAVTFRIDGVEAPASGPPYYATYQVPADMAVGANVGVVVEAVDFAGNRATAEAAITVASAGDTTPPIVTIVAPATARAGTNVALLAHASDAGGLSAVAILVNGIPISTLDAPPYQATYHVPDSVVAGMRLQIESRAVDFAGLQTIATSAIDIVGAGAAAGVITGEVYDDSNGLPLPGATVTMAGSDAAPGASVTTDARGRYLMGVEPGDGLVHITKEGWTRVDRPVTIQSGQALELFDARLLPLSASSRSIAPVLGGTLEANGVSLSIAAGAVSAPTMLTLTRVGPQGLQGMLPAGWSPVVAFDIAPAGVDFAVPAVVQAPRNAVAPGTTLLLAAWDPQRGAWRAVVEAVAGPGVEPLPATVDASSQYAWLRADAAPVAPPAAVIGELLAGVPLPQVPDAVQTLVNPQPKVIFYKPGVRSDVVGSVSLTAPLSSGTRLWSRLTESYQFFSKAEIRPEPLVQDLVFFQSPDDDGKLLASYPVTPSIVFEALTLERGVISVELIAPAEGEPDAGFIDQSGGQATTASGERLEIAAGLTTAPIAARVTKLTAADIGAPVPPGFELVGAVAVSLSGGTLSGSGALSVPRPDGLGDTVQILLARAETVQGETKLVLVGLGRVAGDRVVSEAVLPKNKIALEGVRTGGRYVFLRPLTSVGFVAGQVLGPQGLPFAGAQVGSDRLAIISLSRAAGAYVAAAAIGAVKLTALDLQKADSGFGQGSLAAAGDERAMDLRLIAQPPRIVSVSPAHGAQNVAPSDPIVVLFSEPIQPSSLTGHVRLAAGDTLADVASNLTANNTTLTLRPAQPLSANAVYTLTLEKMKDLSGYELAAPLSVKFSTVDTTAPAPPAAGAISASIPEDGTTTVRGTQGTAGPRDTVTVENVSRQTSTPVLLDSNGGFRVVVQAARTDILKIKIVDQSRNETTVDVPRFTRVNSDGSVTSVLEPQGGRIVGPNGIVADVQAGTFETNTLVTLKWVPESEFPVSLPQGQVDSFPFEGGIEIDFAGAQPLKYVNLSIPASIDDTVRDQWLVSQVVNVEGQLKLSIVDTARFIDQRVTTSSPPCPGVIGQGVYGIYKSRRQVGVGYGKLHAVGFGGLQVAEGLMPWVSLSNSFSAEQTDGALCLPILSGNITIVPNAQTIRVDAANVTPADREFVVRNVTRSSESRFARHLLELRFEVPGTTTQSFQVVAETSSGSRVLSGINVQAGTTGKVHIVVDADSLDTVITAVVIRNLSMSPVVEHTFPQTSTGLNLKVAGGLGDTYKVEAVQANGTVRAVPASVLPAPANLAGNGNLLARAEVGAIDPSPEEIEAYNSRPECGQLDEPPACRTTPPFPAARGVTQIYLRDDDSGDPEFASGLCVGYNYCFEIPRAAIKDGGFALAFNGDASHRYSIIVVRQDATLPLLYEPISTFRITVTNPRTGRVIRTITGQAPPRHEPINLGHITDDTTAPRLVQAPETIDRFDPTSPLSFTFSEGVNYESLVRGTIVQRIVNGATTLVAGRWTVSNANRVATFVPDMPLQLASDYRFTFVGGDPATSILDGGNNPLSQSLSLTVSTFKPRSIGRLDWRDDPNRPFEAIRDISVIRRQTTAGLETTAVAVTDADMGYNLLTIDVSDPANPVETGHAFAGWRQKRVIVVSEVGLPVATQEADPRGTPYDFDANPCPPASKVFKGDLAVSTLTNINQSSVVFFDITDRAKPCVLGSKTLAANPERITSGNERGTYHVAGTALGVATIQHDDGYAAYVAIAGVGLAAVDLGRNIPSVLPLHREREGLYPGDFVDVVAVEDRLVAISTTDRTLEVVDANLTPIGFLQLPEPPRSIAYVEAFGYDQNGNGTVEGSEQRSLAFVSGGGCGSGAGLAPSQCSASLLVIDLTNLSAPEIIGRIPLPGPVWSIAVDVKRRRVVGVGARPELDTPLGRATYAMYLIDVSKPEDIGSVDGDRDGWDDRVLWHTNYVVPITRLALDDERGLVYLGFGSISHTPRGLDIWALYDNCCDLAVNMTAVARRRPSGDRRTLLEREKTALQIGIAAGLQEASVTCGTSIAEVKLLEQGSGSCLWSDDPSRNCLDNYQPGISDHDFEVFFPRTTEEAAQMCVVRLLDLQFREHATGEPRPIALPDGSEVQFEDITFFAFNRDDFEAAKLNVFPPKTAAGDLTGDLGLGRQQLLLKWLLEGRYVRVPGYDLAGKSLSTILEELSAKTGIPGLEGYEWAQLQRYNLLKSNAFVRIKGSSNAESTFQKLFVKQLHDVAKAGIRAALARLVAHPQANARILKTAAIYSSSGCLNIEIGQNDPHAWMTKPCRSFEEFVASIAGRMLRDAPAIPIFNVAQVHQIQRFYRVKADVERITSEAHADTFIVGAAEFIDAVVSTTRPRYETLLPEDPLHALRHQNMAKVLSKAVSAAKGAIVPILPVVTNRGFVNASQVKLSMFKGVGATPFKSITIDLSGGDERVLSYERSSSGALSLDANGAAVPLFVLGPIDQAASPGVLQPVSFTIDLPAKKMKEANRQNNFDGFFYYILDRMGTPLPQSPSRPPMPLPDPDGKLLLPDAVCYENPTLRFTQTFVLADGQEVRGDVLLGMGEAIRIRIDVHNASQDTVTGATACNGVTGECVAVPALAPNQNYVKEFSYTAPSTTEQQQPAQAYGYGSFGVIRGTMQSLEVVGQNYDIVPLVDPQVVPGIRERELMVGGKALRYYRIVDRRTRKPKVNAIVTLEISGTALGQSRVSTQKLTTNAEGIVVTPGELGIAIVSDGSVPVDSTLHVAFVEVDGVSVSANDRLPSFAVRFTPRVSRQVYQHGHAIEGSVGFFKTLELSAETGLEFARTVKWKGTDTFEPVDLTLTRSLGWGLQTGEELNLIDLQFGGVVGSAKLKSGIEHSDSTKWSHSDVYTFKNIEGGLSDDQHCALAAITLRAQIAFDPIVTKLLSLFRDNPCAQPSMFQTSVSDGVKWASNQSGKLALTAAPFWVVPGTAKSIGLNVGAKEFFSIAATTSESFIPGPNTISLSGGRESYKFEGGLDLSASLNVLGGEATENPPKPQPDFSAEIEHFKLALNLSASRPSVETYGVTFNHAKPPLSAESSASVTYIGPKSFGWKADLFGVARIVAEGTSTGTLTYSVNRPQDLELLTSDPPIGLANMAAVKNSNLGVPGQLLEIVPSLLNEELTKFRNLKRQMVTDFSVSNSFGSAFEFPFGVKAGATIAKLGAMLKVKSDRKVTYTTENGINVHGKEFVLEEYEKDNYIAAADFGFLDVVALSWESLLGRYLSSFSDVVTAVNDGLTIIRSLCCTATLRLDGAAEQVKFDIGLLSYPFTRLPSAPREGRYAPTNTEGPAFEPHYGIGGFHQFTPEDRALAAPATLVIDYKDDEIQGLDESSLAIYAWDRERRDWEHVGGARDAAANTVTATVNQLRLYTLAPAMPAGEISLAVVSDEISGQGVEAKRLVRIASSGSLLLNNGQLVTDGTLFTVRTLQHGGGAPQQLGRILTPDADSSRENVQVVVTDGRLGFEVEFDAPFGLVASVDAFVYSNRGTAFGTTAAQQ